MPVNIRNLFRLVWLLMVFACSSYDDIAPSGSIPKVSITIDEKYLWSPDSGLMVVGTSETEFWDGNKANFFSKWEFPAYVEYDGGMDAFSDTVGFRIKGNASRKAPRKGMGLYWRSEYGDKKLTSDFIEENGSHEYKRLYLRHGRPDLIRDLLIARIAHNNTSLDVSLGEPVTVELNGHYWGIYNLREMITPHYFRYKYDISDDSVNILELFPSDPLVDDGSSRSWYAVLDFINQKDIAEPSVYEQFSELVDVENFMEYMIIETYTANMDWPVANMKWYNADVAGHAKFRFILNDLDAAFEYENIEKLWLGDLYSNYSESRREDGFLLFNYLIRNKEFKLLFLARYLEFIDVVFSTDQINREIDTMYDEIKNEYKNHQMKWKEESFNSWSRKIQRLKRFNADRNAWIRPIIENLIDQSE